MNIFLQIRKQKEAVTSSRSHSWTPADSGFQRKSSMEFCCRD